jgi:hypothetical protein
MIERVDGNTGLEYRHKSVASRAQTMNRQKPHAADE